MTPKPVEGASIEVEAMAHDLADRVAEACRGYAAEEAVCSVCLLMPERGDTAWDIEDIVVGREAQRLIDVEGRDGVARWHAAWSPELGIKDGYLELAMGAVE